MKDRETFAPVQSSEYTPHDEGFVERLRILTNEHRSVRAFANAVGIGDSVIRKYLEGSIPSIDKAVAIADGAGVSLEWLAAGRGDMRPAGLHDAQRQAPYAMIADPTAGSGTFLAHADSKSRIFSRLRESADRVRSVMSTIGWQAPPPSVVDAFKSLVLIYNVTHDDLVDALSMIKSDWEK